MNFFTKDPDPFQKKPLSTEQSNNSELTRDLDRISKPYLEELFELMKGSGLLTSNSIAKGTDVTPSRILPQEFIHQVYDLQSVAQVVYHRTESGNRLNNAVELVNYFNNKGILSIPIANKQVRKLFESLPELREEDISEEWYAEVATNNVDLRKAIMQLLEYYSILRITSLGENEGFRPAPPSSSANELFEFSAISGNKKRTLFEIKFRKEIIDLRNIVLRHVEGLKTNELTSASSNLFSAIIIYTNQQDHLFGRLLTQFSKILVDEFPELLNKIFFLPVSISKIDGLDSKLIDLFRSIKGLTISFDYSDSPLNHSWTGPEDLNKLESIFWHFEDPQYGNVLGLRLPSNHKYFIDYKLSSANFWHHNQVTFIVKPAADSGIYIEINVLNDSKSYWFQLLPGPAAAEPNHQNGNVEYFVYLPFVDVGGWSFITFGLEEWFDKTFRNQGLVFNKIAGVRLKGNLTVAKISFD
jgi:hypothetical protein